MKNKSFFDDKNVTACLVQYPLYDLYRKSPPKQIRKVIFIDDNNKSHRELSQSPLKLPIVNTHSKSSNPSPRKPSTRYPSHETQSPTPRKPRLKTQNPTPKTSHFSLLTVPTFYQFLPQKIKICDKSPARQTMRRKAVNISEKCFVEIKAKRWESYKYAEGRCNTQRLIIEKRKKSDIRPWSITIQDEQQESSILQ